MGKKGDTTVKKPQIGSGPKTGADPAKGSFGTIKPPVVDKG